MRSAFATRVCEHSSISPPRQARTIMQRSTFPCRPPIGDLDGLESTVQTRGVERFNPLLTKRVEILAEEDRLRERRAAHAAGEYRALRRIGVPVVVLGAA